MSAFWAWCYRQRSSSRLAFLLQTVSRVAYALLNLCWMPLLIRVMGDELYGDFVSFLAIASLGGLGDLGIGGVIALRVGVGLGQGKMDEVAAFLGSARTVFLCLAGAALAMGVLLSPWLPHWFGFYPPVPGSGSLPLLFCLGSISATLVILASYVNSVNYSLGNLTWPIIPTLVVGQAAVAVHWLLARSGSALTVQYMPYLVSSALLVVLVWLFIRKTHPQLAVFAPLVFNWKEWRELASQSVWSYLWGMGFLIYVYTDRILIRAGFGGSQVTHYYVSMRLTELAFFFVTTAGFVTLPKLTQWLASSESKDRQRAVDGFFRLNQIQAFLGCSASIVYLAVNDLFVSSFFGPDYRVPLHWQFAFALTLTVSGSGQGVMQLSTRCGSNGLRYSGIIVGITGFINLLLSFVSMKLGSIFGIAMATVVAQSFFSLIIGRFVCGYLGVPFGKWLVHYWALPVVLVSSSYAFRLSLERSPVGVFVMVLLDILLLVVTALAMKVSMHLVRSELKILRGMFGASSGAAISKADNT